MKPTHLLAGLLALAAFLLDRVVAAQLPSRPELGLMVLLGLVCGQLALLAMWSVLSAAPWLLSFLAVTAAAAMLSGPFATATAGSWSEWCLVLGLFGACVAVPMSVCRRLGLEAWAPSSASGHLAERRPLNRFQFTLGGLISAMTLAATLLGLARYVSFPWPHAAALACYGTCLTVVALASLWAIVSRRPVTWRWGALAGLCLAAGWAMYRVELVRDVPFFIMIALIESVVICLGLSVLQTAGLQLGTRPDA